MANTKRAQKTHEVIADRIREKIVNGTLKAGDLLPAEDELTLEMGVARTTLREALRVLESQGLIAIRHGRGGGPVVTHPNLDPIATALAVSLQLQGTTVADLDAARRVIEPHIAGQLARKHSKADIKALEKAIDLAQVASDDNDAAAFVQAVVGVHETLIERSGNKTLATLSHLLHVLVQSFYARTVPSLDQAMMNGAIKSYRKLVELIRTGQAEKATAHWVAQMNYTISSRSPKEPVTIFFSDY